MKKERLCNSTIRKVLGLVAVGSSLVVFFFYGFGGSFILGPLAIALFALGFRFGLYNVRLFRPFRDSFPFLLSAMVVAWIFNASNFQLLIASSPLGEAVDRVTVASSVSLLNVVGFRTFNIGDVLYFPNSSRVSAIAVGPVCSGVMALIVFAALYSCMVLDVGRKASKKKLLTLLALGVAATYLGSLIRVNLTILVALGFGLEMMQLIHLYLGYLIFLGFIAGFWYFSLAWIKKPIHM